VEGRQVEGWKTVKGAKEVGKEKEEEEDCLRLAGIIMGNWVQWGPLEWT
jgi:hypothetical protein